MSLRLGKLTPAISGNITQLKAIILADFSMTERNIGYHAGRLSQGYKLLLLKRMPRPEDFEFHGTTLRSGGRYGLPAATDAEDRRRGSVHAGILSDRGADGYEELQDRVLSLAGVSGASRLVKILPTTRHNASMSPADQYPMGGGFLQWDLKKPGLPFLFAAEFLSNGTVQTDGRTFRINSGNFLDDYPEREQLQKFLQQA